MDSKLKKILASWRELGPSRWAESYWLMPDDQPIKLRPMQRAFLDACFEHIQDTIWFLLSAPKKLGKTQCNALFTAWKFFSYPGCLVLLHANSKSQSENLVFSEISKMIRRDPFLLDLCHLTSREILLKQTTSRIQPLAVTGSANAGSNHSLLSSSEAWGIESPLEIENWEELQPPPDDILGVPAQCIVDSYAGVLGGAKTWHSMVDFGLTQPVIDTEWNIHRGNRVMLLHVEGEKMLKEAWHESPEKLDAWIADNFRSKTPGKARTHLYNERVSGEYGIPNEIYLPLIDPDHVPLKPTKEVMLVLGVDAAFTKKGDDIGISGWHVDPDNPGRVRLAIHKVWKGKARREEQRLEDIFEYLVWVSQAYHVSQINFDPYQMIGISQRLSDRGILMKKIPQSNSEMSVRGSRMLQAMRERRLVIYPHDDWLEAHRGVSLKDYSRGGVLFKKSGSNTIDLMISAVMAVPELLDLSEPPPADALAMMQMQLTETSLWRPGADAGAGWTTGRASYNSRFRSPDRRG